MKIRPAIAHTNSHHTLGNGVISIAVAAMGAELMSLRSERTKLEYLWQGDPAFWGKRSPVLFPIVGRLKDDVYTYRDSTYHLPQHGLARILTFELAAKTATMIALRLRSDKETLKQYPFPFELTIDYTLDGNSLRVGYHVYNPEVEPMLFSIGAHPGFRCPLLPGEIYEDYSLVIDGPATLMRHSIEDGLIAKYTKPFHANDHGLKLSRDMFDHGAIVFKNVDIPRMALLNKRTGRGVVMEAAGFPYFGIWAKSGADFVCLEPWHGIADGVDSNQRFEDKEGIIHLKGKSSFHTSYAIRPTY